MNEWVAQPDFDSRWAAWFARRRAHERRVKRRLLLWAALLAMAIADVFGFVRS
jgi:hypothetical protein